MATGSNTMGFLLMLACRPATSMPALSVTVLDAIVSIKFSRHRLK